MRISIAVALLGLTLSAADEPDPWTASDLIQPSTLATRLSSGEPKPTILYVGFPILYRSTHIAGAQLAGPASKPDGLERLKQIAGKLPRDQELIIYCGCCPWDRCPNVRPAFRQLHEMGFTRLKLVTIPTNLSTDWITKGYPAEHGTAKAQ